MPATIAFMIAMNVVVRYSLKRSPKTMAASGSQMDDIKQSLIACHLLHCYSGPPCALFCTNIDRQCDCDSLRNIMNSDSDSHNKSSSCAMQKIIPRKQGWRFHSTDAYNGRIKNNEPFREIMKRNAQSSD